ncbi:MAG: cation:dicarboxylase symporter family transporter [Planctomycetes bacterium]|nr:cation:dicarboxylase symporter family transporter [Planctomycetota bacterium]
MRAFAFWTWKIHWQILFAMGLGVAAGLALQRTDAAPTLGFAVAADETGALRVARLDTAAARRDLRVGDVVAAIDGRQVRGPEDLDGALARRSVGALASLEVRRDGGSVPVRAMVTIGPDSTRARALAPFEFVAELFLRLLRMLIVPLILTSILSGVTRIGSLGALGRMGLRTLLYYTGTSLLAILVGLVLVNLIQPGWQAEIPLTAAVGAERFESEDSFVGIFLRMVPTNVFEALSSNEGILQVIVFSLLFGIFVTRVGGAHADLLRRFFDAAFEVMMKIAEFVLLFIPLGVIALLARVVGTSGIEVFLPLLKLMATVVLGLAVHALVTLPLLLRWLGRLSPWRYARAMSPALLTAFSTSSSSITLPVTLRTVEKRGGVSNRTASFTLPLGATVNMDGTALYECVGVIFLAQFYASTAGFELTAGAQILVVVTALLASIGAAGIPSAGLVMMTTILAVLHLPLEGVMLLLAIDRPLDMLRTAVNVWSDSTCTAIIAVSEGEDVRPADEAAAAGRKDGVEDGDRAPRRGGQRGEE